MTNAKINQTQGGATRVCEIGALYQQVFRLDIEVNVADTVEDFYHFGDLNSNLAHSFQSKDSLVLVHHIVQTHAQELQYQERVWTVRSMSKQSY